MNLLLRHSNSHSNGVLIVGIILLSISLAIAEKNLLKASDIVLGLVPIWLFIFRGNIYILVTYFSGLHKLVLELKTNNGILAKWHLHVLLLKMMRPNYIKIALPISIQDTTCFHLKHFKSI